MRSPWWQCGCATVAVAVLWGAMVAHLWGYGAYLLGVLALSAAGVVLAVIDLQVRRLPVRLTWPVAGAVLVGVLVQCLLSGAWSRGATAIAAGAVLWVGLYAAAWATRGGVGRGDVTLAGICGLAAGWQGWGAVTVCVYVAFVGAGVQAITALLTRRRDGDIAFGPWLLLGCAAAVLAPLS